jgi:SAM-dependent methyltransferase
MEVVNERRMKPLKLLEYVHALEDHHFDLVYPPQIRELSCVHWTPVKVARRAADFLVREAGTRVLDIGCGPGKFCIVGALTTTGRFTGVEQRKRLCDLAQATIEQAKIPNAEVLHGNVTEIDFSGFDAFYLFNPFEENLETTLKIDESIHLCGTRYKQYIEHVAQQLAVAPLGTRVATYCGECEEVPMGYECLETSMDYGLKCWEKMRHTRENAIGGSSGHKKVWRFMSGAVQSEGLV